MEQQTVAFSATILDPLVEPQDVPETVPDPIDELKMKNERHLGRYGHTAYGSHWSVSNTESAGTRRLPLLCS